MKDVKESNRLIADFMEYEHCPDKYMDDYEMENMRYSKDWSQLMPVVEKIEALHSDKHGYFGVFISSNSCTIQGTKFKCNPNDGIYFSDTTLETKIASAYSEVVKFIHWYNNQNQIV